MNKKFGAILLIAGTCIGSGMIALPMVLAKLGIIPSTLLMLAICLVMYYSSFISLELNLQAGHGMPLGALGKHFSGPNAQYIGVTCVKLLSYALIAAYLYGGASIVQKLLAFKMGFELPLQLLVSGLAFTTIVLLLCPVRLIDYMNRVLFICLIAIAALLIVGLAMSMKWTDLPLFGASYKDPTAWIAILPVVFTSFGFQLMFHMLTNYCEKSASVLKQACFWGTLIPALVYILWTSSILGAVYHEQPLFYEQMAQGKADIGDLIQVLSTIATKESVQLLVWWLSLLAIVTSLIGVSIGLFDALKRRLAPRIPKASLCHLSTALLTVLPSYVAVVYIPNAFLTVLGFAGMILAIIAIILPVYLFYKMKASSLYFEELRTRLLVQGSLVVGMTVVACEIFNMAWGR